MAYYTHTNTATASLIERGLAATASLLNAAAQRYARYRVYRQTYNELAGLNDRELNDLGLSRSMIRGLAYEAAQSHTGK
ncbi:DUF1127 domain-containing protein [Roseobacter sp. YSTF-M11]|uniref:DUF1127 domain-containing protein n=1 Tax=Roseobacter insulae TaxID=2859783 RepID=A0A9X1K1S5_9RHOB|nr:DUF1127 domain-containing protein [Roseobacter insulae]MBW4707818.1 DUF1127 domain-containing protein [Roseobacter insulae]